MKIETKHSKTSQFNLVLKYLKSGKRINCEIARKECGCGHLPRRIADLIKEGHKIDRRNIDYRRKFDGKITHIKEYWLKK